jgi:hypothetical protein
VDEIVVVDGSFNGEQSNDGTWEAVEAIGKMGKPLHHIKSKANSLYDKHNEHVEVTGNKDPKVWTWQVDSDEIYLPQHASRVANVIRGDEFNGIAVKLVNVNRIDKMTAYTDDSILSRDTYQMRIYRMHRGLHFQTRDNIFEHIVYEDNSAVQSQSNKIHYLPIDVGCAFNYHCLEAFQATINRYRHYGVENPEEFAKVTRSVQKNNFALPQHPMDHIYRA